MCQSWGSICKNKYVDKLNADLILSPEKLCIVHYKLQALLGVLFICFNIFKICRLFYYVSFR